MLTICFAINEQFRKSCGIIWVDHDHVSELEYVLGQDDN